MAEVTSLGLRGRSVTLEDLVARDEEEAAARGPDCKTCGDTGAVDEVLGPHSRAVPCPDCGDPYQRPGAWE